MRYLVPCEDCNGKVDFGDAIAIPGDSFLCRACEALRRIVAAEAAEEATLP